MPVLRHRLPPILAWAGLLLSTHAVADDTLTGDWGGLRKRLADAGLQFQASYTGSAIEHLAGGFRRGLDSQGLLDVSLELDLEKVLGWKGALFHAEGLWLQGSDPSSAYIGNFDEVSGIAGVATARPYQIWLQQRFLNERLTLKAGWVTLDVDFMNSTGANLFTNASFGSPVQTWNGNFTAPVYPVAALGAALEWKVDDRHELQFGAYDGDTGGERGNLRTSNTRVAGDDGAALLLEFSRSYTLAGRPGTWKLGSGWNTGLTTVNDTGSMSHGNGHAYVIIDQTLLNGRTQDADDRLAMFTRLGCAPWAERSVVDFSLDFGFTGAGLRKGDLWGAAVTYVSFSGSFVAAQAGAGTFSTTSETTLELTYKTSLSEWLTLQPTLQYVITPQDGAQDATVLGLVMGVTF